MTPTVDIRDHAVWFKHIDSAELVKSLEALDADEVLTLQADDVVGEWQRMEQGADGRPTPGIKPIGPMKEVWGKWYRNRRGDRITLRRVTKADEYLTATAKLFSEWSGDEDEAAFRDL
jgi:hypothetical protein